MPMLLLLLSRQTIGALSVFGGTVSYCVMDAFVKLVSNAFPVFEVTFFRMAFSLLPAPQGECEQGNEHGSDSGNRLLMILQKPAAPNRKLEQRDMEGGALLLIGLLAAFLTFIYINETKRPVPRLPTQNLREGDKANPHENHWPL
jgi:hypothetical protein